MRILICSFLLAVTFSLSAQVSFQRIYPAVDRDMFNISSSATKANGFYNLNFFIDDDGEAGYNVTRYFPKGDVEWSFDYQIDSLGAGEVPSFTGFDMYADIATTDDGGAILAFSTFTQPIPGLRLIVRKNLLKLNKAGDIEWSNTYGNEPALIREDQIKVQSNFNTGQFVASASARDTFNQDIFIGELDMFGELIWDKSIVAVDDAEEDRITNFTDLVKSELDSTIVVTGTVDDTTDVEYVLLNKMDTVGTSMWSKLYRPDSLDVFDVFPYNTAIGQDSSIVNIGIVETTIDGSFASIPYVFKTDRSGDLVWSKGLITTDPNVLFFIPSKVEVLLNGNIVVMCRYLGADGNNGEFSSIISPDGDLIAMNNYSEVRGVVFLFSQGAIVNRFFESGLSAMADGGFVYTSTGFTEVDFNHYVIKADENGEAFCSDTLSIDTLPEFPFIMDTVVLAERTIGTRDTIELSKGGLVDYDIPVVTLLDTTYCPQDPIDLLLDATQPNAIGYQWESGEITPTLRVFDEGSYRVIVTIDNNLCFTLCDTATIERYDFPNLTLSPDPSNLCDSGILSIFASPQGPGPFQYMWLSGQTTPSIDVDQPGNYAVTVTDGCMNTAASSINLNLVDFIVPFDFGILRNDSISCIQGESFIDLSVEVFEGNPVSYEWSTGETTDTITVSQPGTYSVTGTSDCGTITIKEIEITDADFEVASTLSFSLQQGPLECIDGVGIITVSIDTILGGDIFSAVWSDGTMGDSLSVSVPGDYTLTVTDICGNEISETITLNPDEFDSFFNVLFELKHRYICQEDAINIFTDPFTLNNVAGYEWSTGETNSGITVTTPGTYSLTVTDDCGVTSFASIMIEQDNFQLEFALQYGLICEPRGFDITLDFSTADIANYEWSTGLSGPAEDRLFVTEGGNYSLTLTDECGNMTEESVDIPNSALPEDLVPSINFDCNEEDCTTIILCAQIEDNLVPETLEWTGPNGYTNGDDCIFLTLNEVGEIVLTVTNVCDPFVASYNLTAADFECSEPPVLEAQIALNCLPEIDTIVELCVLNDLGLSPTSISWTGPNGFVSTDACFQLTKGDEVYGSYNATIEVECQLYTAIPFEVKESTYLCGEKPCLEFPNIFLPNSETEYSYQGELRMVNRSFGPYQKCEISAYKLEIFNRWGKRVFMTEDIAEEWDGNQDGNQLEGGVYMFIATWVNFDNEEESQKGDVTMVR